MPRGQVRKTKKLTSLNPSASNIFSSLMDNMYKTKKVEIDEDSLKTVNVNTFYSHKDQTCVIPNFLKYYISQVQGLFDINNDYKVNAWIIIPPEKGSDKEHRLPQKEDHTLVRVVGSFFSHEVFVFPQKMKLLGDKGVLVPRNQVVKITPDQAQLSYNDKSHYDKNIYPGQGKKYPEKRYIIVLDFISDKEEDKNNEQRKELENLGSNLGGSSNLVSQITKMLGL